MAVVVVGPENEAWYVTERLRVDNLGLPAVNFFGECKSVPAAARVLLGGSVFVVITGQLPDSGPAVAVWDVLGYRVSGRVFEMWDAYSHDLFREVVAVARRELKDDVPEEDPIEVPIRYRRVTGGERQ